MSPVEPLENPRILERAALPPTIDRGPPAAAIAHRVPQARMALMRLIVAVIVVGPLVGSLLLFWSWYRAGVSPISVIALAITYVLGTLGVTVGFHRYFAHKSFKTSARMRALFVLLGSMSAQGSLLYWVSTHRRHHAYSDDLGDPHSPHMRHDGGLSSWQGFWHSHIGWMFDDHVTNAIRFAPDILRDRPVFEMQRHYGVWVALGLLAPPIMALPFTTNLTDLLQVFLAAGPLRLILVHHASWAVGSLSHMYGAQPFETGDKSRNNFWVALFAFGEGLQNNHHAFPRAAVHAFKRSEPDFTGAVLRGLCALGLVWDLSKPSKAMLDARRR